MTQEEAKLRIEKLEKEMKILVDFCNHMKLFYDHDGNLVYNKHS